MFARAASFAVLLLLAAVLPSAAARAQTIPVLDGTVGTNDAFVITLTDSSGAKVTHLDVGTYTIRVHDRSAEHNFHLAGPGVDQATDPEEIVETVWTVTLSDGIYTYQCDPHSTSMKGQFAVGTAKLPPPPAKLSARVGPGKTISVRHPNGSKVTVLNGIASITLGVDDRSQTDNFHLTGKGVNRKTGIGFRGKATWNLKVTPGTYRFRSDKHPSLKGSFSVSDAGYLGG